MCTYTYIWYICIQKPSTRDVLYNVISLCLCHPETNFVLPETSRLDYSVPLSILYFQRLLFLVSGRLSKFHQHHTFEPEYQNNLLI